MRSRRSVALSLCLSFALVGCHFERGPNIASVAGVWVGHARSGRDAGTTGGIATQFSAVEVGEQESPFILSGAAALGVGANSDGAAGRLDLGVEFGYAPEIARSNHLFVRGGFEAMVESDPYTSHFAFEFPTLTAGYAFHPRGDGFAEALHFEFGAHGGLLDAARAEMDTLTMDRVAAAEVGPLLDFRTGAFSTKVGWLAIFRDRTVHQIRSSTCVGTGIVVCVDTRHITLPDLDLGFHGTVGVTFGIGWVAGVLPR